MHRTTTAPSPINLITTWLFYMVDICKKRGSTVLHSLLFPILNPQNNRVCFSKNEETSESSASYGQFSENHSVESKVGIGFFLVVDMDFTPYMMKCNCGNSAESTRFYNNNLLFSITIVSGYTIVRHVV